MGETRTEIFDREGRFFEKRWVAKKDVWKGRRVSGRKKVEVGRCR